jgi:hypothetical protein
MGRHASTSFPSSARADRHEEHERFILGPNLDASAHQNELNESHVSTRLLPPYSAQNARLTEVSHMYDSTAEDRRERRERRKHERAQRRVNAAQGYFDQEDVTPSYHFPAHPPSHWYDMAPCSPFSPYMPHSIIAPDGIWQQPSAMFPSPTRPSFPPFKPYGTIPWSTPHGDMASVPTFAAPLDEQYDAYIPEEERGRMSLQRDVNGRVFLTRDCNQIG